MRHGHGRSADVEEAVADLDAARRQPAIVVLAKWMLGMPVAIKARAFERQLLVECRDIHLPDLRKPPNSAAQALDFREEGALGRSEQQSTAIQHRHIGVRLIKVAEALAKMLEAFDGRVIVAAAACLAECSEASGGTVAAVILSNEASCLVYERPIPDDGLLWNDLVAWWHETRCPEETDDRMIRKALGDRLRDSMSGASDAERNVFAHYFRVFQPKLGAALPALVPQVYLHYNPAIMKQLRSGRRLARQRMDFLLLLPYRSRVVIEVDGAHHFSDAAGTGSLPAYAEMVRADRDLRLLGYEIYRFGANELVGEHVAAVVASFFERLFRKHSVTKAVM